MMLDVVSCLALLDIYRAKTIQYTESNLFYLDAIGLGMRMSTRRRYVLFCTSATWSELICSKLFQEKFENALHFSLVQKGLLGSITFDVTELFVLTDAFVTPFDRLDIPTGFYLFELPLDNLHELCAVKLHTDAADKVQCYEYLSM
jgi:hypothetical protein